MLLVLTLALLGTTQYKSTTALCSTYNYSWSRANGTVGVNINSLEYVSKYTNIDLLDAEVKRQCRF